MPKKSKSLKKAKPAQTKKKALLSRAVKKPKAVKAAKSEDAKLYQAFVNSLTALEAFWHKKATALKKNVDASKTKNDKANQKLKSVKAKAKDTPAGKKQLAAAAEQSNNAQQAFHASKEAYQQAKQTQNKFSSLKKMIAQFERDWLKEAKAEKPEAKKIELTKKSPKTPKLGDKIKPKNSHSHTPQENPLHLMFDDSLTESQLSTNQKGHFEPLDELDEEINEINEINEIEELDFDALPIEDEDYLDR